VTFNICSKLIYCKIVLAIRHSPSHIIKYFYDSSLEKKLMSKLNRVILRIYVVLSWLLALGRCLFSTAFSKLALALLLSFNVVAENFNIELRAETWDVPRHGEALLKDPELSSVMQKWMLNPQQKIELRYPGGEEGELWVEELKDWFVSLGVPSHMIQLSPGSNAEDIINIVLINTVKKR